MSPCTAKKISGWLTFWSCMTAAGNMVPPRDPDDDEDEDEDEDEDGSEREPRPGSHKRTRRIGVFTAPRPW
jgi:hypothetical protein